jgi:hypothetical protein
MMNNTQITAAKQHKMNRKKSVITMATVEIFPTLVTPNKLLMIGKFLNITQS